LQKRVAQFQHLRTTNHQVTSVNTHFNLQLSTPGRLKVAMRSVSYRSYRGMVASFPGWRVTAKWCVVRANHPYLFMEE
jgi:hypothetical protein